MSAHSGPEIATDSLVFCLDTANQKGIAPAGATGFNNAQQLVKNLVSLGNIITSGNTLRLGNLPFFTAFAIDYPEGNFGGAAAGRHGITSGFNVTSGSKIFSYGRALNYAVYNHPTQSWVKTSVYDSYIGTAAVDTFVTEYNSTVALYPDATHVVAGSHRDSFHTAAQYTILRDLGAPANVDSIIGFSSPEWILVGKPGLGAGNGAWAFQNYSVNPDQVAHMNFTVPVFGNNQNYLTFDGTNQKIVTNIQSFGNNTTWEAWIYPTANISTYNMFMGRYLPYFGFFGGNSLFFSNLIAGSQRTVQTATNLPLNNWYHAIFTTEFDGTNTTMRIYTNGVQTASGVFAGAQSGVNNFFTIGDGYETSWYQYQGRVSAVNVHSRTLSATEVQQNFNARRSRYGV